MPYLHNLHNLHKRLLMSEGVIVEMGFSCLVFKDLLNQTLFYHYNSTST